MIIILFLIAIAAWLSVSFWRHTSHTEGEISALVCTIVISLIVGVTWTKSYNSYLDARAFYTATKEQYFSAIEIYKDHAVLDISKAALTDFKYQGYQDNISSFVISLRNRIIHYNSMIVKKRVIEKNPVFSWLIIEPDDDMVIIKMKVSKETKTKQKEVQ